MAKILGIMPFWVAPHNACLYRSKSYLFCLSELITQIDLVDNDPIRTYPKQRALVRNILLNAAISRLDNNDWILIADADTIQPDGIVEMASALDSMGLGWGLTYKKYFSLDLETSEKVMDQRIKTTEVKDKDCLFVMESWAGSILIRVDHLIQTGGYDPNFIGWGYEDTAFHACCKALFGSPYRFDNNVYHLWHPNRLEETWHSPTLAKNKALYETYEKAICRKNLKDFLELRGSFLIAG